ncbi:hypothetical protein [Nocardia australiensis]|nr:hypothetical protein [Nocardia australiensis]
MDAIAGVVAGVGARAQPSLDRLFPRGRRPVLSQVVSKEALLGLAV